jgi:hypothetical protein
VRWCGVVVDVLGLFGFAFRRVPFCLFLWSNFFSIIALAILIWIRGVCAHVIPRVDGCLITSPRIVKSVSSSSVVNIRLG